MNMNQRFKEVRQALNLTQKEFGEKLDLKPNTVAVIESGRRNVTQETVDALSFAFDVNPYWMLYGSGEMFVPRTLDEELAEYHKDQNIEELADLLEVIRAAAFARGYTLEELENVRAKKAEKRGGFEKKILLIDVTGD